MNSRLFNVKISICVYIYVCYIQYVYIRYIDTHITIHNICSCFCKYSKISNIVKHYYIYNCNVKKNVYLNIFVEISRLFQIFLMIRKFKKNNFYLK